MKKIIFVSIIFCIYSCKKYEFDYQKSFKSFFCEKIEQEVAGKFVISNKPIFFNLENFLSKEEQKKRRIIMDDSLVLKEYKAPMPWNKLDFPYFKVVDSLYIKDSITGIEMDMGNKRELEALGVDVTSEGFLAAAKVPFTETIVSLSRPIFYSDSSKVVLLKSISRNYGVYVEPEILWYELQKGSWKQGIPPRE